jgi:hypothetical protein
MSEPIKENLKTSKRSRRKLAMEPLGWDEIVSQPGMGGYLSFLNGPVPLPHLQGSTPGLAPSPGVVSTSRDETTPSPIPNPAIELGPEDLPDPVVVSIPETAAMPSGQPGPVVVTAPGADSISDIEPIPGDSILHDAVFVPADPEVVSTPANPSPVVVSIPAVPSHRLRIRRCAATHDGHSLGEEVLYQSLWKAASPESAETRTIVIGWRGMSQLCRMTPKNCKINTQRLIRKLALEVLSPYNTPESIGTTYRIFSDHAILERRRAAGFEWVVRSRGVEFVSPATGLSIMPICAHTP